MLISPDLIEHGRKQVATGVDCGVVERNGREFRLTRLPDVERDDETTSAPVELRASTRARVLA